MDLIMKLREKEPELHNKCRTEHEHNKSNILSTIYIL